MRYATPLLVTLLASACGDDGTLVRGSFASESGGPCESPPADSVTLAGSEIWLPIADCGFELEVQDSAPLELAFRRPDGEEAAMHLVGLPPGATLDLRDIWFDERGLAFPASVSLEGAELVEVNGLRMVGDGDLPGRVEGEALVLGVSEQPSALLVRPADAALPDLRVTIDSATHLRTRAGDSASLSSLSFGDSVRLVGDTDGRVVVARELIVPVRERAARAETPVWAEIERAAAALGVTIPPAVAAEIARRQRPRPATVRNDEGSDEGSDD